MRCMSEEKIAKHGTEIAMWSNDPRHGNGIGVEDLPHDLITREPDFGSFVTSPRPSQLPPFILL